MIYLVVRDGIVENTVEWDGESNWSPPEGCQLFPENNTTAGVGDYWSGSTVFKPLVEETSIAVDPVQKLTEFLQDNPDVAELIK